jgi:hypothetical protein
LLGKVAEGPSGPTLCRALLAVQRLVRLDQEHDIRGRQVEGVRGEMVGDLFRQQALPVPAVLPTGEPYYRPDIACGCLVGTVICEPIASLPS